MLPHYLVKRRNLSANEPTTGERILLRSEDVAGEKTAHKGNGGELCFRNDIRKRYIAVVFYFHFFLNIVDAGVDITDAWMSDGRPCEKKAFGGGD